MNQIHCLRVCAKYAYLFVSRAEFQTSIWGFFFPKNIPKREEAWKKILQMKIETTMSVSSNAIYFFLIENGGFQCL